MNDSQVDFDALNSLCHLMSFKDVQKLSMTCTSLHGYVIKTEKYRSVKKMIDGSGTIRIFERMIRVNDKTPTSDACTTNKNREKMLFEGRMIKSFINFNDGAFTLNVCKMEDGKRMNLLDELLNKISTLWDADEEGWTDYERWLTISFDSGLSLRLFPDCFVVHDDGYTFAGSQNSLGYEPRTSSRDKSYVMEFFESFFGQSFATVLEFMLYNTKICLGLDLMKMKRESFRNENYKCRRCKRYIKI